MVKFVASPSTPLADEKDLLTSFGLSAALSEAQSTGLLRWALEPSRSALESSRSALECAQGLQLNLRMVAQVPDANVLRFESAEHAAHLITRMAGALRPGGQLLIIDALAAGSLAKELAGATCALLLALRSDIGRVHTPWQIE